METESKTGQEATKDSGHLQRGVIKPCPFCGNNNPKIEREDWGYIVSCEGPDCLMSVITYETSSEDEARDIWNKRAL
jgi:hypothetical protein